mgnify:CR=1 FL=1
MMQLLVSNTGQWVALPSLAMTYGLTLDLGVLDNLADVLQGSGARVPDFVVGIREYVTDLRYNLRQTGGQLLRSAECHGAEQLHRSWRRERERESKPGKWYGE